MAEKLLSTPPVKSVHTGLATAESALTSAGSNGKHSNGTARFLDGSVVPLGAIEPPRGDEVTSRLATVLRVLARATAEACGVDRCSIFVPKGDVLLPVMSQFAGGASRRELWQTFKSLETRVQLETAGIAAEVLGARRPRLVVDVPNDPRGPAEWKRVGAVTMLLVPLVRDDTVIGLVVLDSVAPTIDARQRRRASQLARAIMLAIDSSGSAREMRSRLRASETMLSVGRTIGSTLELQEVVRRITREAAQAVRADSAVIYLMTENSDRLLPYAAYHIQK